jgi:uncharacterized protein (DUF934 family)
VLKAAQEYAEFANHASHNITALTGPLFTDGRYFGLCQILRQCQQLFTETLFSLIFILSIVVV